MNIEQALQVPGMMSEEELAFLAELARPRECIVEVGSWQGRSARAMADNTEGIIFCVDTWADNAYGPAPADVTCHPNWLWNAFRKNMGGYLGDRVLPFRMTSAEGARSLKKGCIYPDMIFLDAGHSYEEIKADILAWHPLLREGGVLCGHDYYKDGPYWPGVKQAVIELIPSFSLVGTIWVTGNY